MKILVTGGAGYIGSVLVPKLIEEGHEVTVLDNLMYKQQSLSAMFGCSRFHFEYGDVRDTLLMKSLISKSDIIIPLSAIVGAPACLLNPQLADEINLVACKSLIESVSKGQIILMPTTNSAYGTTAGDAVCNENSPLKPLSKYAKDKVEVEKILMQRENSVSLRLATVFGVSERMRLDLLVNNMTASAYKNKFLVLFESNFRRNFIHLKDVSDAFLLAIRRYEDFKGGIFNVGNSNLNITKLELAKLIQQQVAGLEIIESDVSEDPDKRDYLISNEKIESLGFRPKVNLASGIREVLAAMPMYSINLFGNA